MKREYAPLFSVIRRSRKLADLPSHRERLFYLMLLPQCDSWGRIGADPRQLNAEVWPMLEETTKTTAACLAACVKAGLLEIRERMPWGSWIQVPDWEDKAGRVGHSERRGRSEWPDAGDGPNGVSPDSIRTTPDQVPSEQSRGEQSRGEECAPESPHPWEDALREYPGLDTPGVRVALDEWVACRVENRFPPWKPGTWRKNLREAVAWGPDGLVESISTSMRVPWKGLFPPKANGHAKPKIHNPYPDL